MPALNYEYDEPKVNKTSQGVAKKVRSSSALSAQKKVVSRTKSQKQNHAEINVPVTVKKKVELQKPEEMKLKKPKAKANPKTENAKRSITATVLGFTMLFLICMRYAKINELTHELGTLEKDLTGVVSLNEQLRSEVDSKTDLNYIEKYAKYQLGMQKPEERQIVRIAYDKQDKISTPITIAEEEEPGFWEKLWKDLWNLVD